MLYTLKIYDVDDNELGEIVRCYNAKHVRKVNEGSTIEFSIRADDPILDDLTSANYVWLRNPRGLVMGRFRIGERNLSASPTGAGITITCYDQLANLANEPLYGYEKTPADEYTVQDLVSDWLSNWQNQDPPIKLGGIDPTIGLLERAVNWPTGSVLGAIRHLQGMLPKEKAGVFYIDANGYFQWKLKVGNVALQTLDMGQNVKGIERSEDWSSFWTRIFLFGEGDDPRSCIKLSDADGHSTDYLDAASAVIDEWGVRPSPVLQDKRIRHPATLLQRAERILEEMTHPPYVWRITPVDLAEFGSRFGTRETIYPGATWHVIDSRLDFDDDVRVIATTRDLNHAAGLQIELSTRSSLSDLLMGLADDGAFDVADGLYSAKYPHIARLFTGNELTADYPGLAYRPGDWRHVSTADSGITGGEMEFYGDDSAWHDIDSDAGSSLLSDDDPEDVGAAPLPGTAGTASRSDHVHRGTVTMTDIFKHFNNETSVLAWTPSTGETLFAVNDEIGDLYYYKKPNAGSAYWQCLTKRYIVAADLDALDAIEPDSGDPLIGRCEDTGHFWSWNTDTDAWEHFAPTVATSGGPFADGRTPLSGDGTTIQANLDEDETVSITHSVDPTL